MSFLVFRVHDTGLQALPTSACVDGTFLTGHYRGTLLTAIGVDGNNQVVPIAFALVESKNSESWLWFLKLLKRALVEERENVCVMLDRNAGSYVFQGTVTSTKELQYTYTDVAFAVSCHFIVIQALE